MNFEKLTDMFSNKSQIASAISQIEKIKEKLFKTNTNIVDEINKNLSPNLQAIITDMVVTGHCPVTTKININDHSKISELLNQIISELKSLPVLKIIAAFDIKYKLIEKIAGRLEQTANKKIIVDTAKNNSLLLNEVIIEFQGRRTTI